jgi:hypothetical protein
MHLHCRFCDANIAGDLFEEVASRSFDHDLALTGRYREALCGPPFIACTLIGMSPWAVMKTLPVRGGKLALKLETA